MLGNRGIKVAACNPDRVVEQLGAHLLSSARCFAILNYGEIRRSSPDVDHNCERIINRCFKLQPPCRGKRFATEAYAEVVRPEVLAQSGDLDRAHAPRFGPSQLGATMRLVKRG